MPHCTNVALKMVLKVQKVQVCLLYDSPVTLMFIWKEGSISCWRMLGRLVR